MDAAATVKLQSPEIVAGLASEKRMISNEILEYDRQRNDAVSLPCRQREGGGLHASAK